jgi:hypothetical protein
MTRRIMKVALVLALIAALAGCGGDEGADTTSTTSGGGGTTQAPGGGDATTTTSGGGTTATTSGGGGTTATTTGGGDAPDINVQTNADVFALAGVDTFRERYTLRITTADVEGFDLVIERVADPEASHMTMDDFEFPDDSVEQITIGEQSWIFEDGEWFEMPGAFPLDSITFTFALIPVSDLTEFDFVGTETVNGRSTAHFAADIAWLAGFGGALGGAAEFSEGGVTDYRMDLWVDPAGFVVKQEIVFSGVEDGQPMTMEMLVDRYDFGANIVIAPPL